MRIKLLIGLFLLIGGAINGQDFPTYLKRNAVKVEKLDNLNDSVYNLISDNRIIMIGEMHSTQEPSTFIIGLVELLTRKGDSVQVGLEIPSDQMSKYISEHSTSSIYASDFFALGSVDGRASIALANIISKLNSNARTEIFFYDTNKKYSGERDSTMYLNIRERILKHPTWKTITLSGNIHNMILPHNGNNTMAVYLLQDKELNLGDKLCSLNHYYQKGTMFNNYGKGLELHQVDNETEYSRNIDYDNYVFLMPANVVWNYSGIYFTRNVTASEPVIK